MFNQIWIETEAISHPQTKEILKGLRNPSYQEIDRFDNYFGKVKRPYLQKREELNLFIGFKRGHLIKTAPPAYGTKNALHYYFIHAFNCIYECQYCYLQGHFSSPDLVFFVNHEDILNAMDKVILEDSAMNEIWFHAGEFSDSLALSHITKELPLYFDFFSRRPHCFLELRTKSANIRELKKLNPLENIVTSFSLAPESIVQSVDLKTPSLKARLQAIHELATKGFPIAIHLDPIIYQENILELYQELFRQIENAIPMNQISYLSMGVVRFTKDVYDEVKKNYPDSIIHQYPMITSVDQKIRYHRPFRMHILNQIKDLGLTMGLSEKQVYLCMED